MGDVPVATLQPNGAGVSVYYVHTDHLNTPRRISNPSNNAIVWRWDSEPFGTGAANQNPSGSGATFVYNPRFPGQYYDAETGLNYNYERDYDPVVGRYVESDPIGIYGGINTYSYGGAIPISRIDPLGLSAADVQRIIQYAQAWTNDQTAQGWRTDPGSLNDACWFLFKLGVSGCNKEHAYAGCKVQADGLLANIRTGIKSGKLKLDDVWEFERDDSSLFTHFWLEAYSNNPSDSALNLDPWNNTFKPILDQNQTLHGYGL